MSKLSNNTDATVNEWRTGWPVKRLGELCREIYRYPSFFGMEHLKTGVPVIRGEHIDDHGRISTDWNDYWFVSDEVANRFPRTALRYGDLVFTVRGTIGKVAIVRADHVAAQVSPNLIRISPSAQLDSEYLLYYLRQIKDSKQAVRNNAVTVATVKASDLLALRIPLPPLPEQKRIARILKEQLATVERARAAAETQLEAARALHAAYLRDVFEDQASDGWSNLALGDCAQLVNGRAYSATELLEKGKYPVLRVGNVFTSDHWYYSDLELGPEKYCEDGDLLYAWSASFGPYIWSGPRAIYHYHIWKVIPRPQLNKSYCFHLLQWITEAVKASGHGIAMRHVTKTGMEKWRVPLPPLVEQKRIAAELNKRFTTVALLRSELEEQRNDIMAIPDAILRAAFQGRL